MEIFGSTLSGNDFNFTDPFVSDSLSYMIDKSEALSLGSMVSAGPSMTIDDPNGTTLLPQLDDIPSFVWWHESYDENDGSFIDATAQIVSPEQGYTISSSDIGNWLSYSISFVDDDYNIEVGASEDYM